MVTSRKPGSAGSAGAMVFRQIVPRSASRVAKLCTGQVAGGLLGGGLGQGARGAGGGGDRAGPGGGGGWLVVVGEQQRREPGLHVPAEVVRQHPQEHVRADPVLGAVPDGPDVQVGIEGAEGPLDLGQGLVGGDDLAAVQVTGGDAGAQHVDAVELGLGGDGVLVAGVADADPRRSRR